MNKHEPPMRTLVIDDTPFATQFTGKFERRKPYLPGDPKQLKAVIPSVVREVSVTAGKKVRKGDKLLVLEAMKMQNELLAPMDGTVKAVHAALGEMVAKGKVIVEYE
jgi:biotin carboxyl carrier protein